MYLTVSWKDFNGRNEALCNFEVFHFNTLFKLVLSGFPIILVERIATEIMETYDINEVQICHTKLLESI